MAKWIVEILFTSTAQVEVEADTYLEARAEAEDQIDEIDVEAEGYEYKICRAYKIAENE